MIGYIEGRLVVRRDRFAIVVTPGGVGYELELPDPVAAALPAPGGEVRLYVHTVVREDAFELYGFATLEDRETFRVLLGITKLGPRTGLAILSRYTTDDLHRIVALGDMDLAWDVLRNYDLEARPLNLDDIVDYVCDVYHLSPEQLSSKSRKRQLVLARNTAFLLARQHTDLSLADIGTRFNRRHSTVVKGITALERHLSLRTPLGRELERTIESIKA